MTLFGRLRLANKAPIGMSPFRVVFGKVTVVFGKACHLPVDIEHKAYWVVKAGNLDNDQAREQRKLQLQELDEIRLKVYEN